MLRFIWAFVILVFVLLGCTREPSSENLYPIDSVLAEQIGYFSKQQATLEKEARVGADYDKKTIILKDDAAWREELGVFARLSEINKAGNRSNYIIDENLFDPGSNLTVKSLTALHDEPVQSLRIFFDKDVRQPRKIEASYLESNLLYDSKRNLLLNFNQVDNKNILTSYSIDGVQKMILSDSVTISINGKIKSQSER